MAVALWHDYTSKHGFLNGKVLEERDFDARIRTVTFLNTFLPKWGLRAIEYDDDPNNPCMILLFPLGDETDTELAIAFRDGKITDRRLPYRLEREYIDLVIRKAYDLLLYRSFSHRHGKWEHVFCGLKFKTYREVREHIDSQSCSASQNWQKLLASKRAIEEKKVSEED